MNIQGFIEPIYAEQTKPSSGERALAVLRKYRTFLLVVVLPVVLVAGYLYLVVSDQYVSEAHFLVHRANEQSAPGIGISQALSAATGVSSAQSEEMSVSDYLTSHDAVETLRRNDRLVERFHRPEVDITSRLWSADPTPEALLKYYRKHVDVKFNTETGITTLQVRGFTPEDSYRLVRSLLNLGEARVNILNQRSYEDAIAAATSQVTKVEGDISNLQHRMTQYRQSRSDIDPKASGQAQITLVSQLTAQLSAAKAQLSAMGGLINRSSPQYHALAARVDALQQQIAHQSARLTGPGNAIANDIGGYEELKVREEFLAKRYEAAAASLERARDEAMRQQLYIVRVVDANMPVKSIYPERSRILLTIVIALALAYAVGWLISAGVREHAA